MILKFLVFCASVYCLFLAGMDMYRGEIDTETWLCIVFGYVGVIVSGMFIGHDFALWSLKQ